MYVSKGLISKGLKKIIENNPWINYNTVHNSMLYSKLLKKLSNNITEVK